MGINVHVYQSDFRFESRIIRVTDTLANLKLFEKIIIFAVFSDDLPQYEEIGNDRSVYRIKTIFSPRSRFLRYFFFFEWMARIFFLSKKMEITTLNPHSVPALAVCCFLKWWKKSKLIYDTHELETEQYVGFSIKKIFSKILERLLISKVDLVFTTSDGYSMWYSGNYKLNNVYTVKNYSVARNQTKFDSKILRNYVQCGEDEFLFIYQGIISEDRGIELLVNVFKKLPIDKHIVFMGFGTMVNYVKEAAAEYKNIHFHPPVSPKDVYRYVQSCDIGFCLIEPVHLSYYHTLPNKLLECLNVGVPVIVSNFPDMTACVSEYDSGWSVEVNEESVFQLIKGISRSELIEKKKNASIWSNIHTWESQEVIIEREYRQLIEKK
jgi:glycosyltransferase involved in cell wall biosynthesis